MPPKSIRLSLVNHLNAAADDSLLPKVFLIKCKDEEQAKSLIQLLKERANAAALTTSTTETGKLQTESAAGESREEGVTTTTNAEAALTDDATADSAVTEPTTTEASAESASAEPALVVGE